MAKKNSVYPIEVHETEADRLVKLEFETINTKPYFGQITDDELLYVWVTVFKRSKDELFGTTSTKSLTRNVRATYKLKVPTKLHDIFEDERFTYEKYLDDGSVETITGRVIGFNTVKPAELGEVVKVTVKTNFGIEVSGILNWLKLYGTPTLQYGFVANATGLNSDVFEAEILLRRHIEEFLPIYGQKAQVNYPGIPRMCNRCYIAGHLRRECNNRKRDWVAYIVSLLDEGLSPELIGTWRNAVSRWKKANEGQSEASGTKE